MNHHGRGHHHHHHHDGKSDKSTKRKESTRDTKLKLFLKRSSEPILNGLPFNQQQVCCLIDCIPIIQIRRDRFRSINYLLFCFNWIELNLFVIEINCVFFVSIILYLHCHTICFFSKLLLQMF